MDSRTQPPPQHSTSDPATTSVKPRRKTSLIGTVIALLSLAALGWLVWHLTHPAGGQGSPRSGPGGRGMPPTTVGIAKAEQADIPVMLDALGTVMASATATVRPQVSGVIEKILFTEGQTVKAGDTLAQIDPRPFENALMQATGQRQRDEAQLDAAQVTLQRYRTLLAQDSIARQDVDTQAALVKQLTGTVMTDRAAESTAKLNLGYTRVAAPIGGRVGLRTVDVGNLVGANDTNGIAVITQVTPIDVEFAVPQDRVPELQARLHEGATLPVTALDRNRVAELGAGRFHAMDNLVDVQTGTVRAKARFDNTNGTLFPNQFVNVRLQMRIIRDATVVPVSALRHGNAGDFVYVVNMTEHTVKLRPVQRGEATVEKVQIVSGLTPGERVVTEGADRLKDGARVILPGDRPGAAAGKGGRRHGGDSAAGASQQGASQGASPAEAAAADGKAGNGGQTQGQRRRSGTESAPQ